MSNEDRIRIARDCYDAYVSNDRSLLEEHLSDDFTFYSPADVGIDRARYFERCWPNAELIKSFDYVRLIEAGDEVARDLRGDQPRRKALPEHRGAHLRGRQGRSVPRSTSAGTWSDARGVDRRGFA